MWDRESELWTEGDVMKWDKEKETFKDTTLLALKVEEGAMSQRMQMTIKSLKSLGKKFSPRNSRRNRALPTLWFQPLKAFLDFWLLALQDYNPVLFEPPNLWVIYYNGSETLIHSLMMVKGSVAIRVTYSGSDLSEFESWLSHLSVLWPWQFIYILCD